MNDPSKLSDIELLLKLAELAENNKLLTWFDMCYGSPADIAKRGPNGPKWQAEFYRAGGWAKERLLMCANGVGKTETTCAELAMHCTGIYPDWWEGARFDRGGFEVWVGSIDNDMQKRGPQRALLGDDLNEKLGTGFVPKDRIIGKPDIRQAGVKEVVDTVSIKHNVGKPVTMKFLTYEQGWRKWQSGGPKIVLWDEEPDENAVDQKDIFSEMLTRLVRNSGIFIAGFTPLLGETKLTDHFRSSDNPEVWYTQASWDDAPHLSLSDRERIISEYPDYQRDARTKGIPMMGEGAIFRSPESAFVIDPIPIPDHWARITGIDFGIGHPCAVASMAWDRDTDIMYLYNVWRDRDVKLRDHADVINGQGKWIPVSWPHDGIQRDKRSGEELYRIYAGAPPKGYGVNMLSRSARYKNDVGGAQPQWPVIEEMKQRIDSGRFKVFRTCKPWLEEYRSYHTKDGQIVSRRDDALKASFYGLMMKRYAVSKAHAMRPLFDSGRGQAPFRTHA